MSDQPEALRLANDLEGKDDWRILDLAAATELRRQHSEIERLNNALKKQAASALMGMDAAVQSSSQQLAQARKLKAESSPDALESERAANAALTAEIERLQAERDALKDLVQDYEDDYKAVVNEQCSPDEKHCSCVVHLRAECDALKADAERWRFVGDNPWRAIDILSDQCGTHPALWHKEANAAIDAARRKE